MIYKVFLTEKAKADINAALDYIEFRLFNPKASDDLLNCIEEELQALNYMPERHPLSDDPVLHEWGIRFILIKNYIAFFVIDDLSHSVHVIRLLYGKRDWICILKEDYV